MGSVKALKIQIKTTCMDTNCVTLMILWNVLFTGIISFIGSSSTVAEIYLACDTKAKESVNLGFDLISFNHFHKSVF